jgi:transposase
MGSHEALFGNRNPHFLLPDSVDGPQLLFEVARFRIHHRRESRPPAKRGNNLGETMRADTGYGTSWVKKKGEKTDTIEREKRP